MLVTQCFARLLLICQRTGDIDGHRSAPAPFGNMQPCQLPYSDGLSSRFLGETGVILNHVKPAIWNTRIALYVTCICRSIVLPSKKRRTSRKQPLKVKRRVCRTPHPNHKKKRRPVVSPSTSTKDQAPANAKPCSCNAHACSQCFETPAQASELCKGDRCSALKRTAPLLLPTVLFALTITVHQL